MLGTRKKSLIPKLQLFFTTTTKIFSQVRIGEWEFKKEGWRKEQAKFEKEDVKEVEDGR